MGYILPPNTHTTINCYWFIILSAESSCCNLNYTIMPGPLWYGSTHRETVERGFEDLQSIMSGSKDKSASMSMVKTKADIQLDATMRLLTIALRLESAANVLEECTKIFCNNESSRQAISKRSQTVKRYILPLLFHASDSMKEISTTLAPIAHVSYAHKRTENKRTNDVVDETNMRMSPDLQLVCDYLSQEERRKRGDMNKVTPPKKKLRTLPIDNNDFDLPLPLNNCQYRKPEVVKILASYKKGSTELASAMRAMIELKYVPVCLRTLRRLIERANTGEPVLDTDWLNGRPPIASLNEVKTIAENMENQSGRIVAQDDVAKLLSDHHMKKIEDAGFVPMDSPNFSSQTVKNYTALMASQANVSISQTSTLKTTTRFAAENSIRACISNLALIGSTHFIPVQFEDSDIRAEIKTLSESTKMLLSLVSTAWGTSVFPVLPELIISTDDTTEYIFEGTVNEQPKFVLATKTAVSKRDTNSLYRVEDSKAMNGLRVKLTFTFTAMGNCFPLVVTVAGLTEKEMPGKDFVHVEIPGLCIGGGGVSVDSNQQVGHLFLMRNTEGAEKARFRYYQEHVLIPGINLQRKNYCNFDITAGTTIPDTATAVAWCDGDMSQIDAIKRSVDLYVENKIIANKQNAAWSGVEQPADLARVFKSIKRIQSKHTVRDIPVDRCPMKRLISDMFNSEKMEFLSLKSSKKNALIDFLSVLPDIATSVCSKDGIKHGFLEAGIIDKECHRYPVFNKILSTSR